MHNMPNMHMFANMHKSEFRIKIQGRKNKSNFMLLRILKHACYLA